MSNSQEFRLPNEVPGAVASAKRILHNFDDLRFPLSINFTSYSVIHSRSSGAPANTVPTVVHSKNNIDVIVDAIGDGLWHAMLTSLEIDVQSPEQSDVEIKAIMLVVTNRYVKLL